MYSASVTLSNVLQRVCYCLIDVFCLQFNKHELSSAIRNNRIIIIGTITLTGYLIQSTPYEYGAKCMISRRLDEISQSNVCELCYGIIVNYRIDSEIFRRPSCIIFKQLIFSI